MAASSALANHAAHFVIFGALAAGLAALVGFQEIRGRRHGTPRPPRSGMAEPRSGVSNWQGLAVAGTGLAGLTHAFVIPEHFGESVLYGVFFTILMIVQGGVCVMLVRRPTTRVLQRVGVGNVAVVGLWLISHTAGLPVGPHHWQPETFGRLDVLAGASEVAAALACAVVLVDRWRSVPSAGAGSRPPPPGRMVDGHLRDDVRALQGHLRAALDWLPRGHPLPPAVWLQRHNGIVKFALLQSLAVGGFGLLRGYAVVLCLADVALAGLPALLARSSRVSRRVRTVAATTSLMLASVAIVDLAGGATEAHFHFFVMVGVVALYQDWTAFGVCFLITVLDHAVMGTILPRDVYGSPAEQRNPIAWAFMHGAFVLAVAFTHLLAWRNNEEQFLSDPLTRLPNRAAFSERLDRAVADTRQPVTVLFVDLDNFKVINDSYGHAAGDRALQAAAERMGACLRQTDMLARLGGDEFAIVVQGPETLGPALAERVSAALQAPLVLDEARVFVRACIGVADSVQAASRVAPDLLRCADLAMYLAKSSGKNSVVVYDAKVDQAVRERAELAAALPRPLNDGQLHVHYQPVVAGREATLVGVEALVRWQHPILGKVNPATFVPLAEETGDIAAIGLWVLQTAAAQMVAWNASRPDAPDLTLAVNVSAVQLGHADFVASVLSALSVTGFRPELLILEVTEGVRLYEWESSCERLRQLRACGIRIAIDDFGTGYSSLSYLGELPADIVKIDQSFVRDLHPKSGSVFLVNAIMQAAQGLHLEVIAEGVETTEQQAVLSKLGCEYSQGYLHARPLPPEGVTAMLTHLDGKTNQVVAALSATP